MIQPILLKSQSGCLVENRLQSASMEVARPVRDQLWSPGDRWWLGLAAGCGEETEWEMCLGAGSAGSAEA